MKNYLIAIACASCLWAPAISYGADSPVSCVLPADGPNTYWQHSRTWSLEARLFADRTASWISMTPVVTDGLSICDALADGQKQILSKAFTISKVGYYLIQGLGDDHLIMRVKDAFDYPLFTITADPGDFSYGTMVSQIMRLSTGNYTLEIENSTSGDAAGVIASITDSTSQVVVNTGQAGWTGRIVNSR
jgi:hypothetical protein